MTVSTHFTASSYAYVYTFHAKIHKELLSILTNYWHVTSPYTFVMKSNKQVENSTVHVTSVRGYCHINNGYFWQAEYTVDKPLRTD